MELKKFEVTTRDGRKFEIEAKDAAAAQRAWASFSPGEQPPKSGAVEDYAKAIGSGLVEGAEALVGLPGDVISLTRGAGTWLGNKARELAGKEPIKGQAPDPLGLSNVPTTTDVAAAQRSVTGFQPYEPERAGARYAKTAATFAPAAATFGAGGGARGVVAAATKYGVVPGLTSEAGGDVASLAYGEDARPYGQVAGALAGPAVAAGAKRAITPFPASQRQTAAVNSLRNEGVESLSAGQRTGNRKLQMFESQQAPAKMAQMADDVGEEFTAAALRRAGVTGRDVLPETINRAFDDWGNRLRYFTGNYSARWDSGLTRGLMRAVGDYQRRVSTPNQAPIVRDYVLEAAEVARNNGGTLPGVAYQSLRSRISRDARSIRDPDTATALRGILSAVDDAMERSIQAINPSDAGRFQQLRREYRNMLVLDRAAAAPGAESAAGVLSPQRLRAASRQVEGYKGRSRGRSDFDDLIRSGEIAMKRMPDSGTASRWATYGVPSAGGMAGALGGYEASDGNYWAALLGGLGGAAARGTLNAALLSKPGMTYLGNQAMARNVTPRAAMLASGLNASIPMRRPLELTVPVTAPSP